MNLTKMNKNIFVACDLSNQKEILELLEKIKDEIYGIKIGLQYISQRSPEDIKELSKFNKPIFYDAKFFDINNTVVNSIKALKNLNISYATVHLLNGEETLTNAAVISKELSIKLIGISILTSFSDHDLKKLGFLDNVEKQVERLIKIADKAGLHGVVCSPHEVKVVKKISKNLKCFTPGIRMSSEKHDQKITMNAEEAQKAGSDYLIIGRPITEGNPKENIKNIINSLK